MAEVHWPIATVRQLNAIAAYIRQFDQAAARHLPARLFALGESLEHFPHRGRPAHDGLRQLTNVPPYVLTYEVIGDRVTILDVRHGRRLPYRRST
ncbi:type II toxin-antitoxin system RelE/ParE family toxin [Sphingomonas jinjuensis]|uniref:type II toxin-antitoxin system RelE/ParE family toxin n=1 Tax=Sphingomonas jinjuensis TaxID=535907 RepID=UPI0016083291|nr:type II toxin-antitoxin system RelE/ParE family toxin [Sphingomonas jinjuensis]